MLFALSLFLSRRLWVFQKTRKFLTPLEDWIYYAGRVRFSKVAWGEVLVRTEKRVGMEAGTWFVNLSTLIGGEGMKTLWCVGALIGCIALWGTPASADNDEGEETGLTKAQARRLFTGCQQTAAATPSGGFRPVTGHTIMWCAVVDREGHLLLIKATDTAEAPGVGLQSDAWRGSIEIAIAKAYTGVAFSNNEVAVTSRAIGLLARTDFPNQGGAVGTDTGPAPLFGIGDTNPYRPLEGARTLHPDDRRSRNHHGIVTFAGGVPVYSNPEELPNCISGGGVLLGAVGVSGDGVDEDETVAIGAIHGAGFCTGP